MFGLKFEPTKKCTPVEKKGFQGLSGHLCIDSWTLMKRSLHHLECKGLRFKDGKWYVLFVGTG
jgi:hypothetical protein